MFNIGDESDEDDDGPPPLESVPTQKKKFNNFTAFDVEDINSDDDDSTTIFGNLKLSQSKSQSTAKISSQQYNSINDNYIQNKFSLSETDPQMLQQANTNNINNLSGMDLMFSKMQSMFKESNAQTEKAIVTSIGNTVRERLEDHTTKIEKLVSVSNEKLRLEMTSSIEDKIKEGTESITNRIQIIENEHQIQSAMVKKLMLNSRNNDTLSQNLLSDKWYDMIPCQMISWLDGKLNTCKRSLMLLKKIMVL
jgi:hypothetical protein